MIRPLLKLLPVLAVAGCATVFSGTSQNVHVMAVDMQNNTTLEDVSCVVTDSQGVVHGVPTNPGVVTVSRSSGGLSPRCTKAGYVQKSFGVGDRFNAVTIVNILFWPGFLVDAATGSMNKYPSHITVFMEKSTKR